MASPGGLAVHAGLSLILQLVRTGFLYVGLRGTMWRKLQETFLLSSIPTPPPPRSLGQSKLRGQTRVKRQEEKCQFLNSGVEMSHCSRECITE